MAPPTNAIGFYNSWQIPFAIIVTLLIATGQFLKYKNTEIKTASKIFKDDCRIDWTQSLNDIRNKIRGLSPYPTAFTELLSPEGKSYFLKIFSTKKEEGEHSHIVYSIHTDSKSYLKIAVKGGFISVDELQMAGKKRMSIEEFLRGFQINNTWKVL